MPKNIVLCSDGTGNSGIKGRGTNVFKVYETVDLNGHRHDGSLRLQVAFYDDGVGTEKLKPLRLLGGIFGWGLSRNVQQLYCDLCRCYEPGDEIFMFGFSRGAFTIRTLAGLVANCGIIDRRKWTTDGELLRLVGVAYRTYRKRYQAALARQLRRAAGIEDALDGTETFRRRYGVEDWRHAPGGKVSIRFVGVWDTVDALGFPVDHIADFWNRFIHNFKFPDRKLSSQVKRGCHALSIDDERHTFHPVMWDEEGEAAGRIEQVWFAGVHSNVGGGYPRQGMSLVALDWIMTKAEEEGLRFLPEARNAYRTGQNVDDKLYDSRSGPAVYYRYKPRDIGKICRENHTRPSIHVSAVSRIAQATGGYAPGNLPQGLCIVPTDPSAPAAGEDQKNLQRLAARIDAGFRSNETMLGKAERWVCLRRGLHSLLLTSSLLLLLVGWYASGDPGGRQGPESVIEKAVGALVPVAGDWIAANIVRPLVEFPTLSAGFLGLFAGIYLLGYLARSGLAGIHTLFWRRTLPGPW